MFFPQEDELVCDRAAARTCLSRNSVRVWNKGKTGQLLSVLKFFPVFESKHLSTICSKIKSSRLLTDSALIAINFSEKV